MYPFSPSVTPAVRTHLDAQVSFFNDFSKSLSRSFQHLCELNMQLGQTMLEESTIASHQLLTMQSPTDAIAVTAARAQPATDKLRAYQQHMSRAVADTQVELARVTEQHVQETGRTARELADQVARTASEEKDRSLREQQESMKNFRDPFEHQRGNGAHAHGNMQSSSASVQVDGQFDGQHASFQGNVQGQPAHASTGKGAGKSN
ncbi:phasin family protein [Massilia sp. PAMC28688]|uniref:phasin family protein n=1 Tax=Massilia sp. PAMC28688 TaxID=2861283 RepID=UPI001C62667C|nr:phasin family protein [Massilia sp. PAMC28688]QYF93791.1 phasin family protein [Massilia sp. PAMC28688]